MSIIRNNQKSANQNPMAADEADRDAVKKSFTSRPSTSSGKATAGRQATLETGLNQQNNNYIKEEVSRIGQKSNK